MRSPRRRGFVLLFALAIFALVGVAILALASLQAHDGRRTAQRVRDAQLEQMLLAGATEVKSHLEEAPLAADQSWKIELPAALTDRGAELDARVTLMQMDGAATVTIHAKIDGATMQQSTQFARGGDRHWQLISAQIVSN